MKTKILLQLVAIASGTLLFTSCKKNEGPPICGGDGTTLITSKVFATGLNNPRGLKFGPDRNLYVAEGGTGGTHYTSACTPVNTPPGPYLGNDSNSRISKIDWNGTRSTLVNYLPSCTADASAGSGITGMADVAFIGNTLYGLIGGAGCSHGVADIPNGVIKVGVNGSWSMVANYSDFLINHSVANPDPDDYTADGNPWSMINVNGDFYVAEPNHQEIDRISPSTGAIHRVVDLSIAYPGSINWIGPTALAHHDGNFYFGPLTSFPIVPGAANIYKLAPDGSFNVFASGFTTVVGLVFDNHDRLYILELSDGPGGPTPNLGKIERLDKYGNRETIASGINFPTAMTFGPDGKLYVSATGIGAPGTGEILQIGFKCEEVQGDMSN